MDNGDYINGFLERKAGGTYMGNITIEGINLSPIVGQYFQKEDDNYLWLKRHRILEYDDRAMSYKEREPQPQWEAYLKKQMNDSVVAYKGEFYFMRFKFSIIGVWDKILGSDKSRRLNLYVERLPTSEQSVINDINKRKRNA